LCAEAGTLRLRFRDARTIGHPGRGRTIHGEPKKKQGVARTPAGLQRVSRLPFNAAGGMQLQVLFFAVEMRVPVVTQYISAAQFSGAERLCRTSLRRASVSDFGIVAQAARLLASSASASRRIMSVGLPVSDGWNAE